MSLIETPKNDSGSKEALSEPERLLSVEIEKGIIGKYAPPLIAEGLSKTEAQLKWIKVNGEKYRNYFNNHKDEIIKMNVEDPNKTIDYIEKELESL